MDENHPEARDKCVIINKHDWIALNELAMVIAHREKQRDVQTYHIVVNHDLCFSCGACVAICPPDSIFLENSYLHIDDATCTRCERCIHMCPVHALSIDDK